MARLMNAIKMGYFPTPEIVIQLLSRWLTPPPGEEQLWRLLDPCCGKGEATQLAHLVGGRCQTWGVELSPRRAEQAAQVMDQVYNTGWRQTRVDEKSVSLLWLNPPYDHDLDGESQRLEIEFLRTSLSTLVDGGILVYVVPRRLLGYEAVARRLAGHFESNSLVVRRFPDGEYERFQQIVVLGVKKPYHAPTKERIEAIRRLADASANVPPLAGEPQAPWPVAIPPAPPNGRFRRTSISRREQIARAHAAGWPDDLLQALAYRQQVDFRPALPPKKGHVAMIMSSGVRGIMRLEKDGRELLVKGRTVKEAISHTEEDGAGRTITVTTHRPKSVIGTIAPDGIQVIDQVDDLTEFMKSYGDVLAERILEDNRPLYDPLHPPAAAWERLGTLGKNRRPLPGQAEPGLLETQKHVAIAMAHALRACNSALIQGEMGTGKTTTALGVIDLLDAYPALVVCPPHLVPKWRREARQVIPGVQTRELSRIGKTASMNHDINDVRAFVEDWQAGLLGRKAIAVVSSTSAKLGGGWQSAMATRYTLPRKDDRGPFRHALERYEKAREELAYLKREGAYAVLEGQRHILRTLRRAALDEAIAYPVCPACGQIQMETKDEEQIPMRSFKTFDKKPLSCNRPVQGWAHDEEGELVLDAETGNAVWVWEPQTTEDAPLCGSALHQFGARHRRYPIADYVFEHAHGFFQLLVVDEIHHYKGKSSDRGIAFARLVAAARRTLGLTGTIYGGKASDIFWLLHRLGIKDIRQTFPYHTAMQWVELYGVLEERQYGSKSDGDDYGAFNATRRGRRVVSEKPGVSPGILRYLIDNTAFLALKDLGLGLPPYQEDLVTVEMTGEQAAQYRRMESHLRDLARGDPRYLSTWLQRSLGRPSTGFRDETVVKLHREDGQVVRREHLLDLPAVTARNGDGALLPKEKWLASYARSEAEAGRKLLLYARQTGEYDIQPRLKQVLEDAGLRAGILTSSVGTRQRETWIEQHAHTLDVLIVNPRLVETGLDLVQFATIVFYEISYSLFTIWQAMRRVWRLGQTKPVKVVFTAYEGTLEESALALMGQKMGAAQLLYGDEVTGAIVPEDTGDFLTQLARTVLEEKELPDLQALFAELQPTTDSPMGSPTARSPRLRFVDLRAMWLNDGGNGRRRRRKAKAPQAQMALL